MSSLFTQITQQAQKQRAMMAEQPSSEMAKPKGSNSEHESPTSNHHQAKIESSYEVQSSSNPVNDASAASSPQQVVTPASDTTVPHSGTTIEKTGSDKSVPGVRMVKTVEKGSGIDMEKLKTIIEELSVMPASSNGLNVRMSAQEMQDIDDFIHDTLRREGLKGYQVSIAKLMRYSMRYMFRVHPQEFITALRAALEVEETLSI